MPSVICPHKEREGAGAVDAAESRGATPSTSPEEEDAAGKVPMATEALELHRVAHLGRAGEPRVRVHTRFPLAADVAGGLPADVAATRGAGAMVQTPALLAP